MDGVNNVGGGAGLDLFFQLPKPGEEGSPFGNLAKDVNGVTLGDGSAAKTNLAIKLGYSEKDTIGSALDEIFNLAAQLNMNFVNQGSFEVSLQVYLNNVDPTNPTIAPVKAMLVALDKDLKSGKLGGVDLEKQKHLAQPGEFSDPSITNFGVDDNLNNLDVYGEKIDGDLDAGRALNANAGTEVKFSQTVGGNPWLAGNVYVAFLISFIELQRLMMQNKVVQGTIELASMNMITELAKSSADAIMAIAKTNQMIHIATAIMSAASIVITVGSMAMAARAAAKTTPGANPGEPPIPGRSGIPGMRLTEAQWGMIGQVAPQVEKMATASAQAATDIGIAQKEGLKEMINSYKTIMERQMNKTGEVFKDSSDAITKLIQDLDRIRQDLAQSVAASLRK